MKHFPDMAGRHLSLPEVRRISLDRPFAWLVAGWHDFLANPVPALAYGLLFSIGGDLILVASVNQPHMFAVALSGFFLVAPLLASGLYELSREHAAGGKPIFVQSVRGLRRGLPSLVQFGIVLAIITFIWERTSAAAFAMVGNIDVPVGHFMTQIIAGGEHRLFVATWFILGGGLAILAFALSVVSVPMMLDRDCDLPTALFTSMRAFAVNLEALVLWGGMIVVLTLIGFATLLVGLVIIMPVLGHASWHAYRELVK